MGIYRDIFSILANPKGYSEMQHALRVVEQNPDAFSGVAAANSSHRKSKNDKSELDEFISHLVREKVVNQLSQIYIYGGYEASGKAWRLSISSTLSDFDNVAARHNLNDDEAARTKEILVELKEISDKEVNNQATDQDMERKDQLFEEGFNGNAASVFKEMGETAYGLTHDMPQKMTQEFVSSGEPMIQNSPPPNIGF